MKVIETPYGKITLLPISEEDKAEIKKIMLADLGPYLELLDPDTSGDDPL